MLKKLRIECFKSLLKLELDLGRINVFVGANGSGKSNLLEAVGVLGAAAFGRVDDETLLRRGVRPGVPRLYKSAFPKSPASPHIFFGAESTAGAAYEVTLWNPLNNPSPAWRFKTENFRRGPKPKDQVVTRSTTSAGKHNQEQGLAALKTVDLKPNDSALLLMDELRHYSIHCPNTPSLRGLVQDLQTREPVGLGGGRLPEAIEELLDAQEEEDSPLAKSLEEVRELIDWANDFSAEPSVGVPLSPSAARSRLVIQFVDRFMAKRRNRLTGYDASEGALYILYCAVLALHPKSPRCLAMDNVDQALNPRLAQRIMTRLCSWTSGSRNARQWLLTVHNPAVLDGIPLDQPDVRLFAVDRDNQGHTVVRSIDLQTAIARRPDKDWTLSRMWMNGLLGGVPNV
ncbi:MAG: DNA replication and repair protein RecF [Phycisphaerae bacterium]|nr:DNA replication and repair protein RecF [Phycisphaerae bacterium]